MNGKSRTSPHSDWYAECDEVLARIGDRLLLWLGGIRIERGHEYHDRDVAMWREAEFQVMLIELRTRESPRQARASNDPGSGDSATLYQDTIAAPRIII